MIAISLRLIPLDERRNGKVMISTGRLYVYAHGDEACFEIPDPVLLVVGSLFEGLDIASRSSLSRDAVRSLAFCVVLQTWRTPTGEAIAANLPDLGQG